MRTAFALGIAASLLWLGRPTPAPSQNYLFTTIAGVAGQPGSADGTNTDARFKYPSNLAIDSAGNIFVADNQNDTIRKLTPAGTNWVVTTIAGLAGQPGSADGTNSDARFYRPNGVVVDPGGRVFVVDHNNHTIRQLTPEGTNYVVTTIAGLAGFPGTNDGLGSSARFWGPIGITLDAGTNLFVVDTANFTIRQVKPSGTNWEVTTIAGLAQEPDFVDGTGQEAQFNYPYGITVVPSGEVFVTDAGNQAVRQLTPVDGSWQVTTIAGLSGNLGSADGSGAEAEFNFPNGLRVETTNSLLLCDQSNNTIRRLAWDGTDWMVSTIAGVPLKTGSADGLGTNALFYRPWDIALDAAGNLYVTDQRNHTIRKGTPTTPTILQPPQLAIAWLPGEIVISWPTWATNYSLEATTSLSVPNWQAVTNAAAVSGQAFVLTNSLSGAASFYRLSAR